VKVDYIPNRNQFQSNVDCPVRKVESTSAEVRRDHVGWPHQVVSEQRFEDNRRRWKHQDEDVEEVHVEEQMKD